MAPLSAAGTAVDLTTGLAMAADPGSRTGLDPFSDALAPDGALARAHPGFIARDGQRALAGAIGDAIQHQSTLVAEAGTGTGKTYAYLVPALLTGGRVLISTGTRNLQDQLYSRDLPRVRDALGVSARIALLKGRSNYVCLFHLRRNLADGRFTRREDIVDLRRIDMFSKVTQTGDRAGLNGVAEEAPAWAMATSTRENCLGQDCPDYGQCFVYKARQLAQEADLVVVNHHLFCADLALRDEGISELLPTASALIFDEAHQLQEVATQFFGTTVSTRQWVEFARDLLRSGLAEARDHTDWTVLTAQIEQAVREWRLHAGAPGRLDSATVRLRPELLQALRDMIGRIDDCVEVLSEAEVRGKELARCAQRARELRQHLIDWVSGVIDEKPPQLQAASDLDEFGERRDDADKAAADDAVVVEGRILWADVTASGCTLHSTPLSVAQAFRRHRDQRARAWIFLSATLAIGGSLEYFTRSLGLEEARQMVVPSPFDFQRQALLFVPQGLGEPASRDYADRLVAAVWPLIVANQGRCFVLCTTLRMVERLGGLLAARIEVEAPPFLLLRQGQGTRAELIDRFREHPAPILVGSASFWEGVDVPGDQLSLVIIDKLPFAPPDDPVVRARSEAVRRAGHDPFRRLHLPATAMVLKQGAGRLIRSEADRGVLVVCDARLADRPYGRSMLKSLPPFRRTRDVNEAMRFLSAPTAQAGDSSPA